MIANQKSNIRWILVSFVFIVLSLFVLQSKFILSVDTNYSVNNSIYENPEFEIISAQTIGIGGGGGAKFSQL